MESIAGLGLSNVQPIRKHNKKMNPALCCRVLQIILCLFFTENTSMNFTENTLLNFTENTLSNFTEKYFVSIFYFRDFMKEYLWISEAK